MNSMKGVGLLALISFFLYNVIQRTSFHLSFMQESILSLLTLISISVVLGEIFPTPPSRPRTKIVYIEKEKPTESTLPPYGSPTGEISPDGGKPEHDAYGL